MRPLLLAASGAPLLLAMPARAQAPTPLAPTQLAPLAAPATPAPVPTPVPTPALAPSPPPAAPAAAVPAAVAPAAVAPVTPAPATAEMQVGTKPSPEALAAARAIGEKLNFQSQARGLLAAVRAQVIGNLARSGNKSPAEVAPTADELVLPAFTAKTDQLVDIIVEHWAAAFSLDELQQLRAFYDSPLGGKLIRTSPALTQAVLKDAQDWANALYHDEVAAHGDELRQRGLLKN